MDRSTQPAGHGGMCGPGSWTGSWTSDLASARAKRVCYSLGEHQHSGQLRNVEEPLARPARRGVGRSTAEGACPSRYRSTSAGWLSAPSVGAAISVRPVEAARAIATAIPFPPLLLIELATDLQQPVDQARSHDGLARAHHVLGQRDEARFHRQAALDILTELGPEITADDEVNTTEIRIHLNDLKP